MSKCVVNGFIKREQDIATSANPPGSSIITKTPPQTALNGRAQPHGFYLTIKTEPAFSSLRFAAFFSIPSIPLHNSLPSSFSSNQLRFAPSSVLSLSTLFRHLISSAILSHSPFHSKPQPLISPRAKSAD